MLHRAPSPGGTEKLLLPLLSFGRERDGVDLSALKLTHHKMRDLGQRALNLAGSGAAPGLTSVTEVGSGVVQDKQKLRMSEIIAAINDLFTGEITEGDAIAYVRHRAEDEDDGIRHPPCAGRREHEGAVAHSPDLNDELLTAIIAALAANKTMSTQALASEKVQARLLSVLLGPGQLWEGLRGASPS